MTEGNEHHWHPLLFARISTTSSTHPLEEQEKPVLN